MAELNFENDEDEPNHYGFHGNNLTDAESRLIRRIMSVNYYREVHDGLHNNNNNNNAHVVQHNQIQAPPPSLLVQPDFDVVVSDSDDDDDSQALPQLLLRNIHDDSSDDDSNHNNNDDDDASNASDDDSSSANSDNVPALVQRNIHDDSSDDDSSVNSDDVPPLLPAPMDNDDWDLPALVERNVAIGDNNNNNNVNQHRGLFGNMPFGFLGGGGRAGQSDDPNSGFFQEFLVVLGQNKSTEMYRYYVSRQERLISVMLRHPVEEAANVFVTAAENNHSLNHLHLDISHRYSPEQQRAPTWMGDEEYYRRWETVGQGIGKLKGLHELQVHSGGFLQNQTAPDYRALAPVTRGATQMRKFILTCDLLNGDDELDFCEGLHNHEHLNRCEFRGFFEPEPMEVLAQELLTVPNLARCDVFNCFSRSIPSRYLPDNFINVLAKPTMTHLNLQRCTLSEVQCEMLASIFENSQENGSIMEQANFQYTRFQGQGGKLIMQSLGDNKSIHKIVFTTKALTKESYQALAESLLLNNHLVQLNLEAEDEELETSDPNIDFDAAWLKPVFEALQENRYVQTLSLGELDHWDVPTALAFRGILESPVTNLRELVFKSVNNAFDQWERIRPALEVNQTLKTLKLLAAVGHDGIIETAASLAHNTALETWESYPCSRRLCGRCERPFHQSISIFETDDSDDESSSSSEEDSDVHNDKRKKKKKPEISLDDCITARAVEKLGSNSTLKRMMIDTCIAHHSKDVSEFGCDELVQALRGNFGLQDDDLAWGRNRACKQAVESLSRLNAAGRRYLLEDAGNRSSGVAVLVEVRDDLDALFIHLQENPGLCEVDTDVPSFAQLLSGALLHCE